MMISDGQATKKLNIYLLAKSNMDLNNPWWDEFELESDLSLLVLTLGKAQYFKDETKDDIINGFISNSLYVTSIENSREEEEVYDVNFEQMRTTLHTDISLVEIELGNYLNINPNLTIEQNKLLLRLLQKYKKEFAWDYIDMKGIHPACALTTFI